jgi:hypothetical protein
MGQININRVDDARDSSMTSLVTIGIVLFVVGSLVVGIAFGGFERFGGGAALAPMSVNAPPGQSSTTINIEPKVNVQLPAPLANPPADAVAKPVKP